VSNGKPDPEPYAKAAALLGYDPAHCVVVEDAPSGIQAGRSAGAKVIGFPTIVPPAELVAAGASWVVADCRSIHLETSNPGLVLNLQS
jgi:sugar-phosphatase